MANQIEKLNGIALTSIEKFNGLTDANIEHVNGLDFVGTIDPVVRNFTTVDSGGSAIGDAEEFHTSRSFGSSLAYDPDTSTIIVSFADVANSTRCSLRVATVSGSEAGGFTLTWGSIIEVETSNTVHATDIAYNTAQDRLHVVYCSTSDGNNGIFHKAFTVRGGTDRDVTTAGNKLQVEISSGGNYNQVINSNLIALNQAANSGNGILHIGYEYGNDAGHNYCRAVRISDTSDNTSVVGDRAEFLDFHPEFIGLSYDATAEKNVVVYDNNTAVVARTINHTGTNDMDIGYGTAAEYSENAALDVSEYYGGDLVAYDPDNNKHHVIFRVDSDSVGYMNYFSVSGSTVTWAASGKKTALSSGTVGGNETGGGVVYSHARNRIITFGSTASSTAANATFEPHSFDGTDYTSHGSAITYENRSGRNRGTGSMRTDASAIIGNAVPISYTIYGGTADGTTKITSLDAGG